MTDVFTEQKRSDIMSNVRSKDTRPELAVRSILHRMGFRFRLHVSDLPGTPDIVLKKYKAVIEVQACFFHRHHGCSRASTPASNTRFWQDKFKRNVERDKRNRRALKELGWRTVTVWECELKKPERLASRLWRALQEESDPGNFAAIWPYNTRIN